ncbi:alpha/beta fold hydrolase [Pseudomonas sp. MDT1-85]
MRHLAIWNYWVNNYLLGNKPPAFDILAWNNDSTRLPAKLHADYLDLAQHNPYRNPGALLIVGEPIDMDKVKVGAYVIAGTTDHITPWQGCYGTARLFGEDSTFVLSNAGHLQSLINPPGNPKSYFYAGAVTATDPESCCKTQARATPAVGGRIGGSGFGNGRELASQHRVSSAPANIRLCMLPRGITYWNVEIIRRLTGAAGNCWSSASRSWIDAQLAHSFVFSYGEKACSPGAKHRSLRAITTRTFGV